KTKAVFLLEPMDQIVYIITAVGQAAFNRLALALVDFVTMYITQMARPNQYACAIRIAQTALDAEAGEQFRRDTVVLPEAVAELPQKFLAYIISLHRHTIVPFLSLFVI